MQCDPSHRPGASRARVDYQRGIGYHQQIRILGAVRLTFPRNLVLLTSLLLVPLALQAADPQEYAVDFAGTGNGALDDTLRATSELDSLRDSAPVSPFGLVARARGDVDRLKTVMESYGYYESVVTIKIDGRALAEGGIADSLVAVPKGQRAKIELNFSLGPLYHLRNVRIDGDFPESAKEFLPLKTGEPAVASTVLAAGARLLTTLQEQGHAFARVDPPVATQDEREPVLDISFQVMTGPKVNIGAISLIGLKRMRTKAVNRRLSVHTGQQFSPRAIEQARHDLLALGPFGSVTVKVGASPDAEGRVPLTFQFTERQLHAVSVNAGYSSDLGTSGGVTWTDRNLFGGAEQLTLSANIINLGGGTATTGLGYDTSAKLTVPDFWGRRDQTLVASVGAVKQSLQAYDQKAVTSGVVVARKLSSVWSASAGVTTANEEITQVRVSLHYTLLAVPVTLTYDSTHLASPLDDPTHGMRNSLSVQPTHAFGNSGSSFVVTQLKASAYVDLSHLIGEDGGRTVLASRVLGGLAQGAGQLSLPPDQRFYGGGSGTIRGYAYQQVGPKFPGTNNDIPIGGTEIAALSLELRQRIKGNFGTAFFIDGGRVSAGLKQLPPAYAAPIKAMSTITTSEPVSEGFRIGYGTGIRYFTPIGPIRFDVALPTKRGPGDDAFEVYIGLGQAF